MIGTVNASAADGVECAARYAGSAGDPIIFVHGVGSSAAIWDPQLEEFGKTYRCFAIELRGNGAAPLPANIGAITREGFALDVLAIADAATLERFHFVGCSLGGVVALELQRRAARRFRSITFVDSFAAYPNSAQYVAGIVALVEGRASLEEFARQRAQGLLPPGAPPERLHQTIAQMAAKTVAAYVASTRATWTGDYRDELKTIGLPVLVLWGEHDVRVTPRALSQELAANIPGATLEVIAGAGHIANADQPAAFNAALRRFLQEVKS